MTCASSLSSRSMTTILNSRPGHGREHRPGQLSGLHEPVRGRHHVLAQQTPLTVLGPFVVPLKCRDNVLGRWRQDSVPHDSRYGYSSCAPIVAPEVPQALCHAHLDFEFLAVSPIDAADGHCLLSSPKSVMLWMIEDLEPCPDGLHVGPMRTGHPVEVKERRRRVCMSVRDACSLSQAVLTDHAAGIGMRRISLGEQPNSRRNARVK
jgi:hypothetical protein